MACFAAAPFVKPSFTRHRRCAPICSFFDSDSSGSGSGSGSDSAGPEPGSDSDSGVPNRSSEFFNSSRPPPSGIDWDVWRTTRDATARLPLLPFPEYHVMLPGEEKTLHLFESRYLALFDASLQRFDKTFGHVLLSRERAALAQNGTLVNVSKWERADVGVKLRIQAIGRIQVQEIEGIDSFFITGRVGYLGDAEADAVKEEMAKLLEMEEQFWLKALRVIDLSVDLGVKPFRSKSDVAVPTFDETDPFGVTSTPPPARHLDAEAKKVVYMEQLRIAVTRGELPLSIKGSTSKVEITDDEKTISRISSVSFCGYDLFTNNIADRQRALESKSCAGRLRTVLTGTDERIKKMEAQLALQRALRS